MFIIRLPLASQNVLVCNGIFCMHGNLNYSNLSGTTATRVIIILHHTTRRCADWAYDSIEMPHTYVRTRR
jgi:hypothetical protein